jgi:hypothetical protein
VPASEDAAGIYFGRHRRAVDANGAVKAIGFATPASTVGSSGNDMHGISLCAVNAIGQTILIYQDGSGHQWSGDVNWFCVAWQ